MEIKEAIKNLTAYIFYAMDDMPKQVGESISVAISALRSQQERQEGCEYCRRGIISVHMEMKPSSIGNEQLNPNRAPWFCPVCGRRLKEVQEDEK